MQTEWWMRQFSNTHTQSSAIPHIFQFSPLFNSLIFNSSTSVLHLSILSITQFSPLSRIDLTWKSHWFNSSPPSAVKFSLKLRFPLHQPPPPSSPPMSPSSWIALLFLFCHVCMSLWLGLSPRHSTQMSPSGEKMSYIKKWVYRWTVSSYKVLNKVNKVSA